MSVYRTWGYSKNSNSNSIWLRIRSVAVWETFICQVLRGIYFCFANLDDILVASASNEEHGRHLYQVFRRLDEHGVINIAKFEVGVPTLEFLGHHIQGLRPLDNEVKAIRDYPTPSSIRQLRKFLGLVNFDRPLIPGCAEIVQPLNDLLLVQEIPNLHSRGMIQPQPYSVLCGGQVRLLLAQGVAVTSGRRALIG